MTGDDTHVRPPVRGRKGQAALNDEAILAAAREVFLAGVRLGDARRSAELRQRHLAVIVDGLHGTQPTPLPGNPPTWEEQTARWISR